MMREVRIVDEMTPRGTLEDRFYEDCLILGPAMLALQDHCHLEHNSLGGPLDVVVHGYPVGTHMVGAIEVRRTRFLRCFFRNVRLECNEEFAQAFYRDVLQVPEGPESD